MFQEAINITDYYLRKRIIDAIQNPKDEYSIDTAIDNFVLEYDSGEGWCRGWFKFQIELLVRKALAQSKQKQKE